jgi:ABC-type multidrug transport system ATPase subunit
MPLREDPGLRVCGITKSFGDRPVLRDASFSVRPGEVVCLTGDNGAGKSTLLRCLVGLARHSGEAFLDGIALAGSPAALALLGYVPQSPALVETNTVEETIGFFASLRGVPPLDGRLPDGFLPTPGEQIAHLSGGQRQRVALSVGLLGSPRLLLLDEPTANLDDAGRAMTKEVLRTAADEGSCVVIVSPALIDLLEIVDRVLVLKDGCIADGDEVVSLLERSLVGADEKLRAAS